MRNSARVWALLARCVELETSRVFECVRCFCGTWKKPACGRDPWNVAWSSDTHRRLEVLGDNKVVINWMNGVWEVKGDEHVVPVRGVVDQFVQWYLDGTSFRPRIYETDWCRHIFSESNKGADTLMDNEDSGPGAQWEALDLHEKLHKTRHIVLSFDGARRRNGLGVAAWIRWFRDEYESFEKSLLRWTCAEERLSDDSWTRGSANGHWTLDSFLSDRR